MLGAPLSGWLEAALLSTWILSAAAEQVNVYGLDQDWINHTVGVCSTCSSKTFRKQVQTPWDFTELGGLARETEKF